MTEKMTGRRSFPGGIHPPEAKSRTASKPVERLPVPERVDVPLIQHFGRPAKPLVRKGQPVLVGQPIGEPDGTFSAFVHSPVSGTVQAVDLHPFPGGTPVLTVSIQNDGQDNSFDTQIPPPDPFVLSPEEIVQAVREAGVVGLGGASFPTAVKLAPPQGKIIDTLVVNGCECEPLLTADYRLMLETPDRILKGAEILRRAVGAQRIVVGIEDNKAEAVALLSQNADGLPAEFKLLRTKYPQGAEKMLIFALLDRKVPRGGLPFEVGVVVHNVATAKAVWEAVAERIPLTERVLTCSGPGIRNPKNVRVRIGTPIRHLIDFCGGLEHGSSLIIYGGPMMGLSQGTLEVPVLKSTTGILAFPEEPQEREFPCIRCGRCVASCPMGLVPTRISRLVEFGLFVEAEKWGNMDCIECGCCQYACPARIPLAHWMRVGKNRIQALRS